MKHQTKSIRPFIGAKNFEISRQFYLELGFSESILSQKMSYFEADGTGFYLQDAYISDWVNNTMVFMEVDDVEQYYNEIMALDLPVKFQDVRLVPIRDNDWGREFFLHDPSGILWHFGEFYL